MEPLMIIGLCTFILGVSVYFIAERIDRNIKGRRHLAAAKVFGQAAEALRPNE